MSTGSEEVPSEIGQTAAKEGGTDRPTKKPRLSRLPGAGGARKLLERAAHREGDHQLVQKTVEASREPTPQDLSSIIDTLPDRGTTVYEEKKLNQSPPDLSPTQIALAMLAHPDSVYPFTEEVLFESLGPLDQESRDEVLRSIKPLLLTETSDYFAIAGDIVEGQGDERLKSYKPYKQALSDLRVPANSARVEEIRAGLGELAETARNVEEQQEAENIRRLASETPLYTIIGGDQRVAVAERLGVVVDNSKGAQIDLIFNKIPGFRDRDERYK